MRNTHSLCPDPLLIDSWGFVSSDTCFLCSRSCSFQPPPPSSGGGGVKAGCFAFTVDRQGWRVIPHPIPGLELGSAILEILICAPPTHGKAPRFTLTPFKREKRDVDIMNNSCPWLSALQEGHVRMEGTPRAPNCGCWGVGRVQ